MTLVKSSVTTCALFSLILLLIAPAARSGEVQFEYRGIQYVSWWWDEYLWPESQESLDALAGTGANWAGLLVTWYMPDKYSSTIARRPQKTPTDEAVIAAIKDMHARGLKVMLKPHVDVLDESWRGQIWPLSPSAWFTSYKAFIEHYAALAQAQGVELFCVGTELRTMSGSAHRQPWAQIIAGIRQVYEGTLTYSALAVMPQDEYATVSFWDLVDLVGVNAYPALTAKSNPSLEELRAGWSQSRFGFDLRGALRSWQATLGKPVVFTEIGYQSADGTNTSPTAVSGALKPDQAEQAACYEAALQVWSQEDWLTGMFWWGWEVRPPGPSDTSFTPRDKLAAVVLTNWYSSGPLLLSGVTASPASAGVGQPVAFSAAGVNPAGGELAYFWYFGDGTVSADISPVHVFTSPGSYTVTLSVSDPAGHTARGQVSVEVRAPLVGTGFDRDGDGFSDQCEILLNSSPTDANSTPLAGLPAPVPQALAIGRLAIHLDFSAPGRDRLLLTGSFALPAEELEAELPLAILVGGLARQFIVPASKSGTRYDTLRLKPRRARNRMQFALRLDGDLAAKLASSGLDDTSGTRVVTVNVALLAGTHAHTKAHSLRYVARPGRIGITK